jgi:alkaline phosphatase
MADFENAVSHALDFAKKDGETLVVVTADHETGGMAILQGSNLDSLDLKFTSKGHTASMIPVFAYGPGADFFNGIYDNTDIFYKIKIAMGWN